jgi:hypothetical protein
MSEVPMFIWVSIAKSMWRENNAYNRSGEGIACWESLSTKQ